MRQRSSAVAVLLGLLLLGLAPPALATADDMAARLAAVGDADDYDADAVVVVDWEDVLVRTNGIGTARQHRVVKILRPAAIKREAVQVFTFDPNTNRLDLIAVRVHRVDGEVEEISLDNPERQPEPAGSIFWGTKQYLVQIPHLRVGDAIETITDMTGFNVAYLANDFPEVTDSDGAEANFFGEVLQPPVEGHWHDEVHFWTNRYPVLHKRYRVKMSKDMPLQYEVYNGELRPAVLFDGDHIIYSFEKEDLEPLHGEAHMEPWPNVGTKLLLATLPSWEDKARWLYEVSEPQFDADEAIRQKVQEVIAGLETDEEKYTALNHWVAENIRYAGTSRGMCEGYTIHKSVETFHDRCGVCKDKAGMLVTMLRVAGYDSFLVMTMARQRVDPVPADQFNHAVTCIRWEDGSLTLLDPTWMPKSRDNWSTLEPLQHVVYGLPEGKELSTSRYFTPEECQATWNGTSRIDVKNKLTGQLDFMAVGAPEGRVRRTIGSLHPSERMDFFVDSFRRVSPNIELEDVQYVEADDFSQPLSIDCDYAASHYALGTGAHVYFKLPMMQNPFGNRALYDLWWDPGTEDRQYGLTLLATRRGLIEETIELPHGWEAIELPEEVELDGPAASLRFEIEAEPGRIHYTCDLRIKRWLIPPEEYANFREVVDQFDELVDFVVTCETENTSARN